MNEYFKTTLLLATLTGLLLAVGYFLGGLDGMLIFLVISMVMNFVSFWFSDRIAIAMSGGKEVDRTSAPKLFADVEELANRMGLPMPKVYVSPQPQPNAFATGRGPNHSAVCFTQGIMNTLSQEELRGVIAHELAHIKNRDVLTSTIAVMIAGVISSIARMALWFGGDRDNKNPIAAIALVILSPIAAAFIQTAISRSREFAADKAGAQATGNPKGLADALIKIEEIATRHPMQTNPAMASLYIGNPAGRAMQSIGRLFSTHPPTADRVDRLMQMQRGQRS